MSDLNLERFSDLKGRRFEVHLEHGAPVLAELMEARPLAATPAHARQPFSLLFKGPASPLLPQSTYQIAHDGDPELLAIFLVPISADASGTCYEAVFN